MRYSIIIVSFLLCILTLKPIVTYAQSSTAIEVGDTTIGVVDTGQAVKKRKKELCRPGQVFFPAKGKCDCPKTQYQDIDLSSGNTSVGGCKTLEHVLQKRLEANDVDNEGDECSSSTESVSLDFSSGGMDVHDVAVLSSGFIVAGLKSSELEILRYDDKGNFIERIFERKSNGTDFIQFASVKLVRLDNGAILVIVNARNPSANNHNLYANILDTNGNLMFDDEKWKLLPLNMDEEVVFDAISYEGGVMVVYANPEYPQADGSGTQQSIIGFTINNDLSLKKEPTVLYTSNDNKLFYSSWFSSGIEKLSIALQLIDDSRILLNIVPEAAGTYSHLQGILLTKDLVILNSIKDIGSDDEIVQNAGFFTLSDSKILAATFSTSYKSEGEIRIREYSDTLIDRQGSYYPRIAPSKATYLEVFGRESFMEGHAYALSWRDYAYSDSHTSYGDYYINLFNADHTQIGEAIKLGSHASDSEMSDEIFLLQNGNLLVVWDNKFRLIDGDAPHCHLADTTTGSGGSANNNDDDDDDDDDDD